MNTRFKVFASDNILQYLCDFIHVLIFVLVSKCRKSPKLTNIVILLQSLSTLVDIVLEPTLGTPAGAGWGLEDKRIYDSPRNS